MNARGLAAISKLKRLLPPGEVTFDLAAGDVYVLGALAYQALTGELPVPADRTLIEYLDRLHRGGLPAVESQRPDTPPELGRVVDRCLLRPLEDRYGSGDELLAELRAIGGVFDPYLPAGREA